MEVEIWNTIKQVKFNVVKHVTDDTKDLICGTNQQKGWYGVRAKNGYIVGGPLRRSVYFEVLVAGTGVSRVKTVNKILLFINNRLDFP